MNNFDLSLLLQQQAILIQSGLPLEDALRMTIEQAETDKQRRMLQSWRSEIIEGRSFSEALRRSPYKIPESIVAGISVGEESGHLHEVLMRLAEDLESSAENRKTISRAMIYPATLISHFNYCGWHYDGLGGAENYRRVHQLQPRAAT